MNALSIYANSDGEATKVMYARLQTLGPLGEIALQLFRAQKCSERAKAYRGKYKGMAYDRKNFSLQELCRALGRYGDALGLAWGWKCDAKTIGYEWVLYIELPQGQVSFHSAVRYDGQDFVGDWDGVRGVSPERIVAFTQAALDGVPMAFVPRAASPVASSPEPPAPRATQQELFA